MGTIVTAYALPREDDIIRVGVVAGRGVGGAVGRNRARRLIREAWRVLSGRSRGGVDLVVVARSAVDGKKLQDVAEELEALLTQAGVIE